MCKNTEELVNSFFLKTNDVEKLLNPKPDDAEM